MESASCRLASARKRSPARVRRTRSSERSRTTAVPTTLAADCRKLTSSIVNGRCLRAWAPSTPKGRPPGPGATTGATALETTPCWRRTGEASSGVRTRSSTASGSRVVRARKASGASRVPKSRPTRSRGTPAPSRRRRLSPSGWSSSRVTTSHRSACFTAESVSTSSASRSFSANARTPSSAAMRCSSARASARRRRAWVWR